MFNRRNAFIGWIVLQLAKRKLRKQAGTEGAARKLGRIATVTALAGSVAVVARKLRRRSGTGGA